MVLPIDSTTSATTAPITSMATKTASGTQTSTASPSSTSTSSSGKSQAWIAGPVIGAVAGVLVIAAVVIFFLRRRITRHPQAMEYQSVSPSARTVSELPTESLTGMVHEMPSSSASRVGPYELSWNRDNNKDYYSNNRNCNDNNETPCMGLMPFVWCFFSDPGRRHLTNPYPTLLLLRWTASAPNCTLCLYIRGSTSAMITTCLVGMACSMLWSLLGLLLPYCWRIKPSWSSKMLISV